ncbi:MAG: glycosyltransferase [Planctomycetota bacterium]|jgi:glycosyltransferase involved in cell wall biosynthesis|nr:glycosyltransferase [Planctomycetota bacterium]
MRKRDPLVSIMIPNFNHARYLDECIGSVLAQTYKNREIVLLDNQSTDNSLDVAAKYQEDGVRLCRNAYNVMNKSYSILANSLAEGEYLLLMGADDAILPAFVEKAVAIMERYPTVGYVHGERDFMRGDGSVIELDPFFNCSFVAPGESVMPLYMVTTIAHPAQGIFRRSAFQRIGGYDMEIDHMNADKSLWFYLSAVGDYGYIREKMCRIRAGADNQTALTQQNFQHPVLCHLIINDFVRFARQFGYPKVLARREEALRRLAGDFLVYAGNMLAQRNFEGAFSYLVYARILDRAITDDDAWKRLGRMHDEKKPDNDFIQARNTMFARRARNYPPPDGFEPIALESL